MNWNYKLKGLTNLQAKSAQDPSSLIYMTTIILTTVPN